MVVNSYPVELLCACLLSKRIYNKQLHCTQTSWPYLISELLVADLFTMLLLLGLAIFLHPRCFCLAIHYSESKLMYIANSYLIMISSNLLANVHNAIANVYYSEVNIHYSN